MITSKIIEGLSRQDLRNALNKLSQTAFDELYCDVVECSIEHPKAYKIMIEEDEIREGISK